MFLEDEERDELMKGVRAFIDINCIFRCDPEKFYAQNAPIGTIPSNTPGKFNRWQFYLRNLTQDSDMVAAVCMLILDAMERNQEPSNGFQLAGLETSSIPLISALQAHGRRWGRHLNSFIVRKERKGYGLFQFVDGIPNKTPVCVVDDLFNSGASAFRVYETALYEFDLDPHPNLYCIVKMHDKHKQVISNGKPVNINALFSADEFDKTFRKGDGFFPFDCDRSFNKRPDYF